jgi:hypothetical protein
MDTMTDSSPGSGDRGEPGCGPTQHAHDGLTDGLGAVILGCAAVWSLAAAAGRSARPEGVLLAVLAVAAGYAAGRIGGALLPVAAPATAAVAVVALVAIDPDGRQPASPVGYVNADAALLVLATGAACCAAWSATVRTLRFGLRLLAVAAAVLALTIGSAAGFAAAMGVVLYSLAAAHVRRLPGLAALALAAAMAVGGTYAVAVDALPARLSASLTGQLAPGRVELWRNAIDLAGAHPLRGVGPGRFAEVAQTVHPDAVSGHGTPESAVLQLAAEQGLPGAALLAAAYGWVLWALWRSPRPAPIALTAGAALTGLAMQAGVDHVLSFAAVTAAAGLLAGLAMARRG